MDCASQWKPSAIPVPSSAEQFCICQFLFLIEWSSNSVVISSAFIAVAKSCLFANINNGTPGILSSCSNAANSNPVSYILRRSALSITQTIPIILSK